MRRGRSVLQQVVPEAVVRVAGAREAHALQGRHGLQGIVFVTLGLYFTWFWSHGGQTLAMKAWRIRLVQADGDPVSMARAWLRYGLSWLWFLPALLVLWWAGPNGLGFACGVLGAGIVGYAALTRLHPDRQFWHDLVCRTRLVSQFRAKP